MALSKEEKRLATLEVETERKKRDLVEQLKKTPIVQVACERTDVGRSTYYSWRAHDHVFGRAADKAMEAGKFLMNDMVESRLLGLIKEDNLTAMIFWLKHNHPKYATVNRIIHQYEVATESPSIEEENIGARVVAEYISNKLSGKKHPERFDDDEDDDEPRPDPKIPLQKTPEPPPNISDKFLLTDEQRKIKKLPTDES